MDISTIKKSLLNPRFVFIVWSVVGLVAALIQVVKDASRYNNFLVFRGASEHLFASKPLYAPYPLEYHDLYHYGPVFGLIIAPFQAIPVWLALPLWVVGMTLLLGWMIRRLPVESRMQAIILWLAANDLYCAGLLQQFNIAVAALLIGSLVMIRQRREGWAALFIVIGMFVKVYGIVGLAFFFFVKRKWRFIGWMCLWSTVALLLPLLFVSPEYLFVQYKDWIIDLTAKNHENRFCDYTNISLLGLVRKVSGSENYSDLWLLIPGVVMFLLSYLRWTQFKNAAFQLTMLASLLLFIVVFSSGSESSGYVIATCGVGIWWVLLPRRGVLEWTLLVLTLVVSFSHNLFPREFRHEVFAAYALRAIPYTIIWFYTIFQLWFADFSDKSFCTTPGSESEIIPTDSGGRLCFF